MISAWRKWRVPMALGLALACGAGGNAALAQFFFRPFAYSYRYDLPPEDEFDAPRFASRRAVARILSREGFQLVGPLGRRGDQVVATGVSRREGETRFFIDPFEGEIVYAVRIGPPPPAADRRTREDDGFVPQLGGSHPVVKEIGRDRTPPEEARGGAKNASRQARQTPETRVTEPPRPRDAETPRPATQAVKPAAPLKPAEAAKSNEARPVEWAKPAEIAKPGEAAKATEAPKAVEAPKPKETAKPIAAKPAESLKPVEAAKAPAPALIAKAPKAVPGKTDSASLEPGKTDPAKAAPLGFGKPDPAKQAAKPLSGASGKAPAAKAVAARSTGRSHRAIVPPAGTDGVTVVTPSAPAMSTAHSPAGARTPQSVAMPKSE